MDKAQEILDRFNDYYAALYDADGRDDIPHGFYSGFVKWGDELIGKYPDEVSRLCEMRHDIFSSDREVAALAMAWADVALDRAA